MIVGVAAAVVVACALPSVAGAQDVTVVNTPADHAPDGCAASPGDCTLREAIADARAAEIEVPEDDYELVLGELEITRPVTIRGTGPDLPTIHPSIEFPSRVVFIGGAATTVRLSRLRITDGDHEGGFGGGIFVDTAATLLLTDSEVLFNRADSGGGIWADGTLQVDRSLIAFNDALGDADGGAGLGGGIALSLDSDPVTLTNTTLSGNNAFNLGGGIFTRRSIALRNVSIVDNSAPEPDPNLHGGGLYQEFAPGSGLRTVASNVLVAQNVNGGCGGTAGEFFIESTSGLLDELDDVPGPSCNAVGDGNVVTDDALIESLEDNGGATDTHALLPGSPAIDAGGAPCPPDDQRGYPRPADAALCDIGAYEATPGPAMIDGAPLDIWSDGLGRLQFRFDGQELGVFYDPFDNAANAGLEVKQGEAYYPLGAARIPVSPPAAGSVGNTHTMTSAYMVGPDLLVSETIEYANASQDVDIRYEMTNTSEATVDFRAGELADLFVAGNDTGTGVFAAGPPRFVGGRSQDGVVTGLVERTPWTHFQASHYGSVFDDFADAGLTDTIVSDVVDNGVGVEWERTLGPDQVATIDLEWRVGVAPPVNPPASPPVQPPAAGGGGSTPPPVQQLPPPEAGESVNVVPKQGTVKVKLKGTKRFVELQAGQQVPVGSEIDTRKGRVTLTAASNRSGGTATADFYDGVFLVRQTTGARPITRLTLTEKLSCPKSGKANAAAKRKKKRRLWGDGSGKFRTEGRYSSATIRGTKWLTEDSCNTTLTRVVTGSVTVRDLVKKRSVVVRAGKKYVARKRRSS